MVSDRSKSLKRFLKKNNQPLRQTPNNEFNRKYRRNRDQQHDKGDRQSQFGMFPMTPVKGRAEETSPLLNERSEMGLL